MSLEFEKEGTLLVQALWIKLYFSLVKTAHPPWQAHCNLFIEGLNARDFFRDLSHADLNCRWNFWKWFRLWGLSHIPGAARFNQPIIWAGSRVTCNEIRLPSLSGDQGGIVCHDNVAVVLRHVRVSRVINFLAWSGWLRVGEKKWRLHLCGIRSAAFHNAVKLNGVVWPTLLITNDIHLRFSHLKPRP